MICTEDEAKTKECCGPPAFARLVYVPKEPAVERGLCTASNCMAWVESTRRDGKSTGYCGLIAAAYIPSSTI